MSINIDTTIWINNPNGWPMYGNIESAKADVFSLEKHSNETMAILIGQATLPKSIKIDTHKNTSLTLTLSNQIEKDNKKLVERLVSDCHSRPNTTKIAVN